MESIWSKTADIPPRGPLEGDLKTEVAVLGGGMAGVLIAYLLRQAGVEATVLEAKRIGGGQTRNTTAKVTSQHGQIYPKLIKQCGEDGARAYAAMNQRAIEEYRRIIREHGIDCQWESKHAYLYSAVSDDAMREEVHAARTLGLDAIFTTETGLPFPVKGAARFSGQAQFHPLRFLSAISADVEVYEDTRALTIEDGRVMTERGAVEAKHIVFATHYPFLNAPGYYFLRQHQERSYALALEGCGQVDGMYLGADNDGLSFRNAGKYLILGGGNHRTGENSAGGKYELLRRAASQYWPQSQEIAHWSAQDCMPLDSVPYIGRFADSVSNWYVATGFGKWGMTSSMVSAIIIRDLICGRDNPDAAVFSPQRSKLPASAKNLLQEGVQAVKGLSRRLFAPPRADVEELPPGHGGVVDYDGEKLGVYRDMDGELFVVSARCPHLGCQLEWNPDEKSWDCPCHGSRFDHLGRLLDNPAQENLPHA